MNTQSCEDLQVLVPTTQISLIELTAFLVTIHRETSPSRRPVPSHVGLGRGIASFNQTNNLRRVIEEALNILDEADGDLM